MRRLLAIGLMLVLSFPLVSPLLASTSDSDAAVPVCCRKGGAHHCLLTMREHSVASDAVQVSNPPSHCPAFPKAVTPIHGSDLFVAAAAGTIAGQVSQPPVTWQAETRARIALDRARRKRGPPATRLS